jgi:hypothetical protein
MHRNERRAWVAMIYSITSSARASSVGGTFSQRAFAVLRLIASSYFGRRLYGKVGRFLALQNADDVAGGTPKLVGKIRPV